MDETFGVKGLISTSFVDWPGRICSVIFLAGCNFRCHACHNHKLVLDPGSVPDYPVEELVAHLRKRRRWIERVTVTGGEPTLRGSLPDLLRLVKSLGMKVKLDTNGTNPEMLERLIQAELIDAVYMDVKAPLEREAYSRVAGVPVNANVILRSIDLLRSSSLEVAFRTTVIPGLVQEEELQRIRDFLGEVDRYAVQPFRNVETLNPMFSRLQEFDLERFEQMKLRFEVPAPAVEMPAQYASTG